MQKSTTTFVSTKVMSGVQLRTSPYSRDNVRKGIFHYLLGRGMSGVASFASVILLVRHMDVDSYAGYTALTGLIMMAGILAGLGLERALARYIPEGRMHHAVRSLKRFIWMTSLLRLVAAATLTMVVFVLWPFVIRLFEGIRLEAFPLALACFLIATSLFQHFSFVLQSLVLQKTLTRILVIQWGGRLAMILALIATHFRITLEQSLWVMAAPEMMGVVVFVLVIHWHLRGLIRQQPQAAQANQSPWPRWGEVMRMAMHNYGYNLLAAPPQGYFMRMLAAALLPAPFVAAYGFFLSLVERARQYLPVQLFYNLFEPLMIAAYLKDRDFGSLNYRTQLLYKTNFILLIPAIAWLAAAGPVVVSSITGGKFVEYSWILVLVVFQAIPGSHVVLLQLILNAVGASVLLLDSSVLALIAMAVFLLGIMTTDLVYLICAPLVFSLINNWHIVHKLRTRGYSYKPAWKRIFCAIVAGAIALPLLLVFQIPVQDMLGPIAFSFLSGLYILTIYLLGLCLMGVIEKSELILVRSLLLKKHRPVAQS